MNCSDTPPCEVEFDIINQNGMENEFSGNATFTVQFGERPNLDRNKYRYEGDTPNLTTIEIVDDGGLPTLEMSSDKTELTEAENIVLKFTHGSVVPTEAMTVNYTIDQNGLDFIDPTHTAQVTIQPNNFTNRVFTREINLIDDEEDERDSVENDFGDDGTAQTTTIEHYINS